MSEGQSGKVTWPKYWVKKITQIFSTVPVDTKCLIELLRIAESRQVLDADALSIIEGALQVSNMQVREIMIPRSQVVTVNASATPEEFLPLVIESSHSRFPVVGDKLDNIIGILLAKDLLPLSKAKQGHSKFNIKDLIRPAIFVPESKRLNVLLKEFRENRNHMAIVIDEYGGVSGVVTIEDVLEQIVGEIEDEYDVDDESYIKQFDDENYVIKAFTPIDEFNEYFNTELSDNEFDTIGGIVLQRFGRIPERNEDITIEPFRFTVLNADSRQIRLLKITSILTDNKKIKIQAPT